MGDRPQGRPFLKIISWNVNGIRACADKGFFELIEEQHPDIFCIQETKAHPDVIEERLVHPLSKFSYFSTALKRGYSGTATFCDQQPLWVGHGIGIRKFDIEGRFVVSDHGEFLLYNVYFPNGGMNAQRHQFKQEFLLRFLQHLKRKLNQGRQIIVVGDYNVAYLDQDVYDPMGLANESGFLPEERAWFQDFLKAGFIDCYRTVHPDTKGAYTWWSYRENGRIDNRGWRIDHICVTPELSKKIVQVEILNDQLGSDHCPVMVELNLSKKGV